MKYFGHIEIKDNKIIFVYHEKEFPNALGKDYNSAYDEKLGGFKIFNYKKFNRDWEEYEASKREIKVNNAKKKYSYLSGKYYYIRSPGTGITLINNQSYEAEVKENLATITKIL